jgi:hypothetical protein
MSHIDDATTRTPVVNVLTWILLITSILTVLTRLGTIYWIYHKLRLDDYMICLALVGYLTILLPEYYFEVVQSKAHHEISRLGFLHRAVHYGVFTNC